MLHGACESYGGPLASVLNPLCVSSSVAVYPRGRAEADLRALSRRSAVRLFYRTFTTALASACGGNPPSSVGETPASIMDTGQSENGAADSWPAFALNTPLDGVPLCRDTFAEKGLYISEEILAHYGGNDSAPYSRFRSIRAAVYFTRIY